MTKNWKVLKLNKILIFFLSKLQFTASMKDVQATGEALNPQKRTSSTSKLEMSFCLFLWIFLPSWIRNRIQPTKTTADPELNHTAFCAPYMYSYLHCNLPSICHMGCYPYLSHDGRALPRFSQICQILLRLL
jgi:hypothetical protein